MMSRIACHVLLVIACMSVTPWIADASNAQAQVESVPISSASSHILSEFHRTLAAADSSTGSGTDTPSTSKVFDPLRITMSFVDNPGFDTTDSVVDSMIFVDVGKILDIDTAFLQLVEGRADNSIIFDLYSTARSAPTPYSGQSAFTPAYLTLSHSSQEFAFVSLHKNTFLSRPADQIAFLNALRTNSTSELYDSSQFPYLSKLRPLYAILAVPLPTADTVESSPQTSGPFLLGGVIAVLCVLALCTCALTYLLWKKVVSRRQRESMEHDMLDDQEAGTSPRAHHAFGQMQSEESQMHTDDLELDIDQLSMEHEDDIRRAHRKGSTSTASVELADRKFGGGTEEHKSSGGRFPMNVAGKYVSQHVIASSDRELHHGGGSEDEDEEDEAFSSRHVRAPSGADLHSALPVALHPNEDETDN